MHDSIHKLVAAIKELNEADSICATARVTDKIRNARGLIWNAGEELCADFSDKVMEMSRES